MSEFILPLLPPRQNLETIKVLKQLAKSNRALAELEGCAETMPGKNILINAIMINEAKDSSAIENIITAYDELYQKMVSTKYNSPAAKEVPGYRTAIWQHSGMHLFFGITTAFQAQQNAQGAKIYGNRYYRKNLRFLRSGA